jgi:hypothetical protein
MLLIIIHSVQRHGSMIAPFNANRQQNILVPVHIIKS